MITKDLQSELTYAFGDQEQSDARLSEMILYVSNRCAEDPGFSPAKLNRLLFLIDFLYYKAHGKAITGAQYIRAKQGPMPRRFLTIRDGLIARNDLAIEYRRRIDQDQKRPVALREADIDMHFSASEISFVDQIIEMFRDQDAERIMQAGLIPPWEVADTDALIPYEAVFLGSEAPSQPEIAWARKLNQIHGWEHHGESPGLGD